MGGGISVVDLDSGEIVEVIATGPSPNYIAVTGDGQTLFVSNTGNYHQAVSPVDGSILVTSRGEAKLWVLDPVSLATVDEIPLDGIGHQISIDAR